MEAAENEFRAGGQPLKKIPRFQRTLIAEKQKEALIFVFAHEQRPNSRCIEQLALKLGLTQRTVTNWFHNYRTRGNQSLSSSSSLISSTPTPGQVLARALNASDLETVNWFRELAELVRRHSDVNPNALGIIDNEEDNNVEAEEEETGVGNEQ